MTIMLNMSWLCGENLKNMTVGKFFLSYKKLTNMEFEVWYKILVKLKVSWCEILV